MRCILQLYSPNCSTTVPAQAPFSASLAHFPAVPLPASALLLQFTLLRRRPAISQQFNFLLCQQVESNAMLIKCYQPSPSRCPLAVNIKGKLKMSAAGRVERRKRGRVNYGSYTARIRNVVRFCADVFAYLPATQTEHHTQQWPIYPNMCAASRGRQGRGEWWLPLLFDIYLPFPPNHKDTAASLPATRRGSSRSRRSIK